MMRTVHLHGHLKKQFGASHRFEVATAAEALRALNCAFPGDFTTALQTGAYKLMRGGKRNGMALPLELVTGLNLGRADLHIMPAAAGAANARGKGTTKAILGVALIGAAIFMAPAGAGLLGGGLSAVAPIGMGVTWGNIALVGLGLALSGTAMLLAGDATTDTEKENDTSFTINGPSNVAKQGQAIPLIYGEVITGSTVVSFDADIEDIGAYRGQNGSMGASVQAVSDGSGKTLFYGAA